MRSANGVYAPSPLATSARAMSPVAWFVIAVLSLSLVALNHDFDVVGGRFEETVTSGAQLDLQEEAQSDVMGGTLQRKFGLAGLLAAAGLALMLPARGTRLHLGPMAMLVAALMCWTVASLLWSTEPTRTVHELIRLAAYVITALILTSRFSIREIVWSFLVVCVVAIATDVGADVAAGTFRPWTAEFRLGGALHPNHVGRLGAILAMIGIAVAWERKYRRWAWLPIVAGLAVVLMSVSRSSLLSVAVGIGAIAFLGMSGRRFAFHLACLVVAFGLGLGFFAVCPPSVQQRLAGTALMGRTEDASSLTGRWPLWTEMWSDSAGRRLQGHGYGAYWTADRNYDVASVIGWYPTHSHSIYMELLIDLGLIGLFLCLAIAFLGIMQYSRLVAVTKRFEFRLLGALLLCALTNGLLEVNFIWPRLEGLFLGMAVLALVMKAEAQPHLATNTASSAGALTYSPTHVLT